MFTWLIYPTLVVLAGSLSAAVIGVARIRSDPRRPSNGIWLSLSLVLLWFTALFAGLSLHNVPVPTVLVIAVTYPAVGVIVLLLALAFFLAINSIVVVRRERLRLATVVPAAIGTLIVATILAAAVQAYALLAAVVRVSTVERLAALLTPILGAPGVVLIFELMAYTLYAFIFARVAGDDDPAEVVVVLGSGLAGDKVTPLLASRLDAGVAAYQRSRAVGAQPVMVVSGGKGDDERRSEAEAMAEYLTERGFPHHEIITETASTTTRENLQYSIAALDRHHISWNTMAIATSNFHVLRAASLARQLRIPSSSAAARTAAYYLPSAFLREFAATVVHFRRGTILGSLAVALGWTAASWYFLSLAVTAQL